MLVFVEGGKLENQEKTPQCKARTNKKLNHHMAPGRNRTRDTLGGRERSHQCAIPAPGKEVGFLQNDLVISDKFI